MRSLLEAGVEIDVFPIYPLDQRMWRYAQPLLDAAVLPRERVHHLGFAKSLGRLVAPPRRGLGRFLRDAGAVSASALRYGPVSRAKTAYVLPKAWAAAARYAERYDHVLGYWGNYAGTCAYLFHRLQRRRVPFSLWVHAGTDLYFRPAYLRQKLEYADNIITCCDFNRSFMLERYRDVAQRLAPKIHVCYHGLDLPVFPFRPDGGPPATRGSPICCARSPYSRAAAWRSHSRSWATARSAVRSSVSRAGSGSATGWRSGAGSGSTRPAPAWPGRPCWCTRRIAWATAFPTCCARPWRSVRRSLPRAWPAFRKRWTAGAESWSRRATSAPSRTRSRRCWAMPGCAAPWPSARGAAPSSSSTWSAPERDSPSCSAAPRRAPPPPSRSRRMPLRSCPQ